MKRLLLAVFISNFLVPSAAHALSVTIDSSFTSGVEFSSSTSGTRIDLDGTYGGFTIIDYGTGGARVESIEGSTDKLNLTGLRITNNNSTTQTLTIYYRDLFDSTGPGWAGQQLSGAFSQASTSNTITSYAATDDCGECEDPIDATVTTDGTLRATNRLSFGPLRETESINACTGANCYEILGSTAVTLLPGRFVNLAGSHDIMVIEGATNNLGIIADFDAHQAEFHSQEIPEPGSLLLLLTGIGPLGYWVRRRQQRT